jgi:hypothetical protein
VLGARGLRPNWEGLARDQCGAITRAQLLDLGWSADQVRWLVGSGRFQQLHRRVYATFTGPLPDLTRLSGAVLYAGAGAVLSGRTALALHGMTDLRPGRIEVCLPESRRVRPSPGLTLSSRRDLERRVQSAPWPPRIRLEEAVLDVADALADPSAVIALVLATVQQRRTTPQRLRAALKVRARHRWRRLVTEVIHESADGVHSMLERRYLHDVERAHGLPRAERQPAERSGAGTRYRDLRYRQQRVVVELDGASAHPDHRKRHDDARNRGIVLAGDVPLVYGWVDVAGQPCRTAAEVAAVLAARGWPGRPRRCGPGCPGFP